MQANLTLIAERLRQKAEVLENVPVVGGDYEQGEFSLMPTELSAPIFLRDRAKAYDEAQYEMDKWKPYANERILFDPRRSRRLLLTAAILAGIGLGLLAYVVMAVIR